MFFYVLLVPTCILLSIMFVDLRRQTKHDQVLFRFCQVRRDIFELMKSSNENGCLFDESDYRVLRALLDATNETIHHFDRMEITMFNLRWLLSALKNYIKNADRIDNLVTSHEQINRIKNKFRGTMLLAFFSYTPMIKSQIIIGFFIHISGFIIQLGVKSLRLKKLVSHLSYLKDDMHNFSNHTPLHA